MVREEWGHSRRLSVTPTTHHRSRGLAEAAGRIKCQAMGHSKDSLAGTMEASGEAKTRRATKGICTYGAKAQAA
eukprot:scaffold12125_cov19-Prasinocladus_malaysianus.AAC.1